MKTIQNIAVLLTCHNRKSQTLKCLKSLYSQEGFGIDFKIEVYLVDDASTDGTSREIKIKYPEVNIIQGNGNLYWNRGMHLAWQTAADAREFDLYLWLNDDTFLNPHAINTLLLNDSKKAIVCGTTNSIQNHLPTYGGFSKKTKALVLPNGSFQECDHFNGNCVLIPDEIFKLVGNLDPVFHHAVGDFDYGLRAKKLGVKLLVAPDYIGTCESHPNLPKWRSPSVSLINRMRFLYTASSGCYPPQFFTFDKRHNGFSKAVFHFFTIHLRAIVPALWNFKSN